LLASLRDGGPGAGAPRPAAAIQLHVELDVPPANEKELVTNFRNVFRPAIRRQPGFVEVKLLKLRSAVVGPAPAHASYRLVIGFASEEQRQAWVKTDEHQRVWPAIEKNLQRENLRAILYDEVE
jgi:heme-degrading monooxygenase HmoA